jgi:DNA-3-methyladenine glycosylase II
MNGTITLKTLQEGAKALGKADPDFARIVKAYGLPGLRSRATGFGTVLRIIAGQQVSTFSAQAIARRLDAIAKPMTPEIFIKLTDAKLRAVGFSGPKTNYGRSIAEACLDGSFSFRRIARMEDEAAIEEMVKLKGIGRWSAEIYLLFALRRPDLWPVDDLGVMLGYAALKNLPTPVPKKKMLEAGEALRPWRSVAARLLWHYYGLKRQGLAE